MSKKKQTLACCLLLTTVALLGLAILEVAGANTAGDSYGRGLPTQGATINIPLLPPQAQHPAYSFTASRIVTTANGQQRTTSTLQRFQRSDGLFKMVITLYTSEGVTERVETQFGLVGIGVFKVDEARRRLVFAWPHVAERPENLERVLRDHPLFRREESVRGVNTIVWRHAGSVETEFTDEYRAPSLGGLQIKTVKVSRRGREALEPSALEMGEPAQNVFAEFFLYPVDYSSFERGAQEAEERNATDIAQFMREALGRMRQIRP